MSAAARITRFDRSMPYSQNIGRSIIGRTRYIVSDHCSKAAASRPKPDPNAQVSPIPKSTRRGLTGGAASCRNIRPENRNVARIGAMASFCTAEASKMSPLTTGANYTRYRFVITVRISEDMTCRNTT
jgi:hypothetical protein